MNRVFQVSPGTMTPTHAPICQKRKKPSHAKVRMIFSKAPTGMGFGRPAQNAAYRG